MANKSPAMEKGYFRSMFRAARQVQSSIPVMGILAQFFYLFDGLFPAVLTILTVRLFNSVEKFLQGSADFSQAVLYGCLIAAANLVYRTVEPLSSVAINAGVYEKGGYYAPNRLAEKSARLPMIYFEDANTINLRQRASQCVNREIHGQIYMNLNTSVTSFIIVIYVCFCL